MAAREHVQFEHAAQQPRPIFFVMKEGVIYRNDRSPASVSAR